jgi:MerR family transcriptional regulator/heat shock protein HspR
LSSPSEAAHERPLYSISVAAELAGLPLPTLRLYEERGLVTPARTRGGTRRYSDADIERIQRITALVDRGVTLAGVGIVLELEDDNADLTAHNQTLRSRNRALRKDNRRLRHEADEAHDGGDDGAGASEP